MICGSIDYIRATDLMFGLRAGCGRADWSVDGVDVRAAQTTTAQY